MTLKVWIHMSSCSYWTMLPVSCMW